MKAKTIVIGLIIVMLIGIISAEEYQVNNPPTNQQIFNSMNLIPKIQYGFDKGYFLFSTWGQENGCSVYPSGSNGWAGWIHRGGLLNYPATVSCSKVNTQKCAIDVWYDLSTKSGQPSEPNWNNYLGEFTSGSFSDSKYQWYYAEVYGCPDTAPQYTNHQTAAFKCINYNWTYVGSYSQTQSCSYDTSGANLCWCSDTNSNFYIDLTGGVHCQPNTFSSVNDGTWCSTYQQFSQQSAPRPINVQKGITKSQLNSETSKDLLKSVCTSSDQCETGSCQTLKYLQDSGAVTSAKATSLVNDNSKIFAISLGGLTGGALSTFICGAVLSALAPPTGGVSVAILPICFGVGTAAGAGLGAGADAAISSIANGIKSGNTASYGYCVVEGGGTFSWDSTLFNVGGINITPTILAVIVGIIILLFIIFK